MKQTVSSTNSKVLLLLKDFPWVLRLLSLVSIVMQLACTMFYLFTNKQGWRMRRTTSGKESNTSASHR